jgi:hypothetical protein
VEETNVRDSLSLDDFKQVLKKPLGSSAESDLTESGTILVT